MLTNAKYSPSARLRGTILALIYQSPNEYYQAGYQQITRPLVRICERNLLSRDWLVVNGGHRPTQKQNSGLCKEMNEWPFGLQTFRGIPVKTAAVAAAAVQTSAIVRYRVISFMTRSINTKAGKWHGTSSKPFVRALKLKFYFL